MRPARRAYRTIDGLRAAAAGWSRQSTTLEGVMGAQGRIRFVVAALASLASLALSWPYWRDFGYWPESHTMWLVYFVVGFALAVYVFYVFFVCLSTLFEHDRIGRKKQGPAGGDNAARTGEGS
ncbi:MAG TPA: hypothetical protein PKJ45_03020 [Rubrivivax sp.]|nr:hypothetical protein [Rubrivivax sp.]